MSGKDTRLRLRYNNASWHLQEYNAEPERKSIAVIATLRVLNWQFAKKL
jgi:hypothetical protein